MTFEERIQHYREEPLTRQMVLSVSQDYKRPGDNIGELVKAGILTIIKNGLYIPGPNSKIERPESFLIANHLWGPSYISMETALYYHRLIPERVFEVSSITVKRSRYFRTPIGRFTYRYAALPYYIFGIQSVRLTPRQFVLMASPEKALCDKIGMTSGIFLRSTVQVRSFLSDDLRIDKENLRRLDINIINSWIDDSPKKSSLRMLTKPLRCYDRSMVKRT
ncbi:MAG: type IV toxin-antitoxin system AbiEi family antitoxin domain-containing protein [Sphingobacterium sp.]